MEPQWEDVVLFLGADRADVTNEIRLAALLPTNDDNEPAPEKIPEADQPPPPQGQLEHNKICDSKTTSMDNPCASVQIKRELPVTLFLLFQLQFF